MKRMLPVFSTGLAPLGLTAGASPVHAPTHSNPLSIDSRNGVIVDGAIFDNTPGEKRQRSSATRRGSIAALLTVLSLMPGTLMAQGATTEPLIQASNVTYLGAFAIPATDPLGTSRFTYGGHAVTPYTDPVTGERTLFMQGHAQKDGQVAQVAIPASFVKSQTWSNLPLANVLQIFHDVTDGKLGTAGDSFNGMPVNGMLAYNGRLIVAVAQSYGASQVATHGVSGFNLSLGNDFKGFYTWTGATAPLRAIGGEMTPIPPEWRALLGGPALTGTCCQSIISATSAGPSATVFNPDNVGVINPIPGTTVLNYPITTPVCGSQGCEATQNSIFNLTTRVPGVAFPPGSRSVLFFGEHGTGPYCYGTQIECNDQERDGKGPHAPPYRDQIWAYDANDLVAVKNGTKQSWQVQPYAVWQFGVNEMYTGANSPGIQGAGYDPETGRLYIAQTYGDFPRIDVYQITVPNTAPPPATRFYPVTPCRVADTRNAAGASGGPALTANADRAFPVGGLCGIPMDAASVAVNATVTQPTAGGFVRMWSASDFAPDTTALSFAAGKTRANNGIVRLGGGSVSARYELAGGGAGTTHFILDVVGYFR